MTVWGTTYSSRRQQCAKSTTKFPSAVRNPVMKRVESRPRSTKLFTHVDKYPQNLPSYTQDYGPKPIVYTPCVRSGTSSGMRRNNPHPSEAFMVWRLPSRFPALMEEVQMSTATLKPEELISQRQFKSTYQDSYIGLQQGQLPRLGIPTIGCPAPPKPTYTTNSSMRHSYQVPKWSHNLKGNTTRYGCNVNIVRPACGVVPTLCSNSMPTNHLTWYSTDFNGNKRPPTPVSIHLPPVNIHLSKPQLTARFSSGQRLPRKKKHVTKLLTK